MDWGTLIAALVGAAIPGTITLLRLRRDRPERDATAVASAQLLVEQLEPLTRLIFAASPEVEQERHKVLSLQVTETRQRLLALAASHPRRVVRERARIAQHKLGELASASTYALQDTLHSRANAEWMVHAQKTHTEAHDALQALIDAMHPPGLPWIHRRSLLARIISGR